MFFFYGLIEDFVPGRGSEEVQDSAQHFVRGAVPWACEHISIDMVKQLLIIPDHKHTWGYTFMYICSTVERT